MLDDKIENDPERRPVDGVELAMESLIKRLTMLELTLINKELITEDDLVGAVEKWGQLGAFAAPHDLSAGTDALEESPRPDAE